MSNEYKAWTILKKSNFWDYRKIARQLITKKYFTFDKHASTKYNNKNMFDRKICAIAGWKIWIQRCGNPLPSMNPNDFRNWNLLKVEVSAYFQPTYTIGINIVYEEFPQLKVTETWSFCTVLTSINRWDTNCLQMVSAT